MYDVRFQCEGLLDICIFVDFRNAYNSEEYGGTERNEKRDMKGGKYLGDAANDNSGVT